VRKIGCFITEGWTEAGAMSIFLKKINSNFEYVQCFPTKRKYTKGLDGKFNGLTGEALITEVYRRVECYKNDYLDFSAIILKMIWIVGSMKKVLSKLMNIKSKYNRLFGIN
jgi:hypothetical protein